MDSKLVDGLEGRAKDYAELKQQCEIRDPGKHVLYRVATGNLNGQVVGADGRKVRLRSASCNRDSRTWGNLFSSWEDQGKGISTIISSTPYLHRGIVKMSLKHDRKLFTLDYEMAPTKS